MIYLYAIVASSARAPDCAGLDDRPVQILRTSQLAALYSAHEQLDHNPDPERLWRHDQVLERAMSGGPTLPVRFGTTLPDTASLGEVLRRDEAQLQTDLERVRGCVELAVRVRLPPARRAAEPDGSEYVRAKLARHRERQEAARGILEPLAELASSARSRGTASGEQVISASYLVPETGVEQFVYRVRLLQAGNPEVSMSCTGPWAPYSFVGVEEAG